MTTASERTRAVRQRIEEAARRHGRDPDSITLIAASKRHSVDEIRELRAVGVEDFGENYVQELQAKARSFVVDGPHWHFIGHLQRNKVKVVVPLIDMLHTLDSVRLCNAVNKTAAKRFAPLDVLLQVNIGNEPSKDGVTPEDAQALAAHVVDACPNLALRGLMTVPPVGDPERWLKAMRDLRDTIAASLNVELRALSMGMSGDLETAIKYGATHVRIGTSLFGPRSLT